MEKNIIWLIQSNQITPTICDFLKTFQTRMERLLKLSFIVPDSSFDILEKIKDLNPTSFKTSSRAASNSYNGYLAKRNELENNEFSEGLGFADALLLDDLGGGNVMQTFVGIEKPDNTRALIIQIPTPLGSSEIEERIFHAAILWGRQNNIPVIGYELLPLDTRWTLAASLPDGIITRYGESYQYLKEVMDHQNIWLLPLYEASIFTSISTSFNVSGAKASYHYRNTHSIPAQRTILFVPHNVAMVYEYQEILNIIGPVGNEIHLMFSVGEDQVRGSHSQEEIIKTVYNRELKKFASYSFHDAKSQWEILMADSLIASSTCFQTMIAREINIPSIIFDPSLPPIQNGPQKSLNKKQDFLKAVKKAITSKQTQNDLGDILMQLAMAGIHNG